MRRKFFSLFVQEAILVIGIASFALGETQGPPGVIKVGEKLTFDVIYYGIPAGRAVMEVKETVEVSKERAYWIRAETKSSRVFSLFYPVDDSAETFISPESLLPYRFEKHQKEGHDYRSDRVTIFDRRAGKAIINNERTVEIPEGTHDPLSAIYYLRQLDYTDGEDLELDINDGKNYRIQVKVHGKCKVAYGDGYVDAILIQPIIRFLKLGGIFQKKGDIKIWLSDDERRVPLIIQAQVVIGHLDIVLVPGEMPSKPRRWEE